MVKFDKLAEKVFGILKGNGYQVKLFTVAGAETVDPAISRRFFVEKPGLMVTIDEENNEIQLNKSNVSLLQDTKVLQNNIKKLANEFLMNYTVRNYGKSIQPRDFSYQAKIHRNKEMNNVAEGLSKLKGSKKTSHQTLENVRILVKHRRPVEEEIRGSRSRNIQSIFLEQNGERFRFPYNNLHGARAMARHMSAGGNMQDAIGSYVIESVGHLIKLNEFIRYATTNKLINEGSQNIIEVVKENILSIKTELYKLSGTKSYESIKSRIQDSGQVSLQETDLSELRDMFTIRRFDEKIDEVLPIVNRLVQEKSQYLRRIEEAATKNIRITSGIFTSSAILEFKSSYAKLGHKLSELSVRMVENTELSEFVGQIGRKLCKESELTAFEKDIVNKVLENLQLVKLTEGKKQPPAFTEFETFFDKYNYIFV